MKTLPSRRLRAPLLFALLALVVVVIGGATYGWRSVPDAIPVVVLITGRDTSTGLGWSATRRSVLDIEPILDSMVG